MNILILGSGAREHAIAWKVKKSKLVKKIFVIPGNPGIEEIATCISGNIMDFLFLNNFAIENKIDLIISGPEAPLVSGLLDYFESKNKNVLVFGPNKKAAQLEGSKCFSKDILREFKIPTALYENFNTPQEAMEYIDFLTGKAGYPVVIKADGLAAGKGVAIVKNRAEAERIINEIMIKKIFGDSGSRVVIEEFLRGYEVSLHLIVSGSSYKFLPFSQDHKQIFDEDKGPNTGGMGAYSPCPLIGEVLTDEIEESIIKPLIKGFKDREIFYKGILYIGLMICNEKPFVLEFNVRLGDPETQVLLPLIETDFVQIIVAAIKGNLDGVDLKIKDEYALAITCASQGYPDTYKKGFKITGLDEVKNDEGIIVFHAGTKLLSNGNIVTNGGRVLTFVAFGKKLLNAIDKAYKNIVKIHFEGIYYRRDIGKRKCLNSLF